MPFRLGKAIRLTDTLVGELSVTILDIIGRAALVEYRPFKTSFSVGYADEQARSTLKVARDRRVGDRHIDGFRGRTEWQGADPTDGCSAGDVNHCTDRTCS